MKPFIPCEICSAEEANCLSYLGPYGQGYWFAVGDCTTDYESYYIEFDRLLEPNWETHLESKRWIDIGDFNQAVERVLKKIRVREAA